MTEDPMCALVPVFFAGALRQMLITGRCDVRMEQGTKSTTLYLYADSAMDECMMVMTLPLESFTSWVQSFIDTLQ